MKKLTMLLATGVAVVAMAGCGNDPAKESIIKNITGGSADEQQAIKDAAEKSIITLSGSTGILPTDQTDLSEDNGDYVKVTTSQTVKVNDAKYVVKFEWSSDTANKYLSGYSVLDATHGMFEINYPGKSGQDGSLSVKLDKASCGGAVSTDTGCVYNFNVKHGRFFHKDSKISELTKLKEIDSEKHLYGYELVDYETNPANAYFITNPENADLGADNKYYYVNCFGKVIYNAPDGNWGLIADGDDIMEIYAGSAKNILPGRYPAMNNKYVSVAGNMSQYNGNMQIGFITGMKKASASDLSKEPTMKFEQVTPNHVAAIIADYDYAATVDTYADLKTLGFGEDDAGKIVKVLHDEKHVEGKVEENNYYTFSWDKKKAEGSFGYVGFYGDHHYQCVHNDALGGDLNLVNSLKMFKGKYVEGSLSGTAKKGARFTFKVNIGTDAKPCNVTVAYDYHVDEYEDDSSVSLVADALKRVINNPATTFEIKGTLRFAGSNSNPFNQTGGEYQLVPYLAEHVVEAA